MIKFGTFCAIVILVLVVGFLRIENRSVGAAEAGALLVSSGHHPIKWSQLPTSSLEYQSYFSGEMSLAKSIDYSLRHDIHGPTYFVFFYVWQKAFGGSLESTRSWSLFLLILLTALLVYGPFDKKLSSEIWLAGLLLALSASFTYHATNARPYMLANFFLILGAVLIFYAQQASSSQKMTSVKLSLAGIFLGIAFLTHYFTAFSIAALCFYHWKLQWNKAKWQSLAPALWAFLVSLPAFYWMSLQLPQYRPPPNSEGYPGHWALLQMTLGEIPTLIFRIDSQTQLGVAWLLILTVLAGLFFYKKKTSIWFASILFFSPLVLLLILSYVEGKHFTEYRYLSFSTFGLCLFIVLGLQGWFAFKKAAALLISGLVVAGISFSLYYNALPPSPEHPHGNRHWKEKICQSPTAKKLLLIDETGGRGWIAHWIFEIPCDIQIAVTSPTKLFSLEPYDEIWFIHSDEYIENNPEKSFENKLKLFSFQAQPIHKGRITKWQR